MVQRNPDNATPQQCILKQLTAQEKEVSGKLRNARFPTDMAQKLLVKTEAIGRATGLKVLNSLALIWLQTRSTDEAR